MQRVTKTELACRLAERVALASDLTPEQGLGILIYGWKKYRKYGAKYCHALEARDWMYITEVMDLSNYAQVDLSAG